MKAKKVWTKDEIKALLQQKDEAVQRAILRIYEAQTADEQSHLATLHRNGVGFNGADAYILTRYAKFILKGWKLYPREMKVARKRIMKYAGQLTKIANS